MKSTGIVRRIDALGRFMIPKYIRKSIGLETRELMEVSVTEDHNIVLTKYTPGCVLCGEVDPRAVTYFGKLICTECVGVIVARVTDND